jgi:hypothetical protein
MNIGPYTLEKYKLVFIILALAGSAELGNLFYTFFVDKSLHVKGIRMFQFEDAQVVVFLLHKNAIITYISSNRTQVAFVVLSQSHPRHAAIGDVTKKTLVPTYFINPITFVNKLLFRTLEFLHKSCHHLPILAIYWQK